MKSISAFSNARHIFLLLAVSLFVWGVLAPSNADARVCRKMEIYEGDPGDGWDFGSGGGLFPLPPAEEGDSFPGGPSAPSVEPHTSPRIQPAFFIVFEPHFNGNRLVWNFSFIGSPVQGGGN